MSEFTFELVPFDDPARRGTQGAVGPYGEVRVLYVKPIRPPQPPEVFRTELVSERLPETYFTGIGSGGQPSLTKGDLRVGGTVVELSYNRRGIRRASRALHLRYGSRAYTYTSRGLGEAVELHRDGASVAFKNGRFVAGTGFHRLGRTRGSVDEADLAIALVLEMVDVSSLTLGGAIAAAPFKILSRASDGGGE